MVTSLPSLSLSLSLSVSLSLSHRKYLTHNIGSASALPIIACVFPMFICSPRVVSQLSRLVTAFVRRQAISGMLKPLKNNSMSSANIRTLTSTHDGKSRIHGDLWPVGSKKRAIARSRVAEPQSNEIRRDQGVICVDHALMCSVAQVRSRPRPVPDPRAPCALAESKQRQWSIFLFLLRSLLRLYLFHA